MTEHTLQLEQIVYFRNNYERKGKGIIIPIPNEYTYKNKNAVICKGAADLLVILPGKALFIENKTTKGTQSKDQKKFEFEIKMLGFDYYICKSIEDFVKLVQKFSYDSETETTNQTL